MQGVTWRRAVTRRRRGLTCVQLYVIIIFLWVLFMLGLSHLIQTESNAFLLNKILCILQKETAKQHPSSPVNVRALATTISTNQSHNLCPKFPPGLLGKLPDLNYIELTNLTLEDLRIKHSDLSSGGEWQPRSCVSRHRVAIIIPYRDRLAHLTILLAHLLPILKRQQLHFRVFLAEQFGNSTFNKGRIMNVAFKEARKLFHFDCVVFHDVDMIPEDDRNVYNCSAIPRHMAYGVDEFSYKLRYQYMTGGVINLKVKHFLQVNGYANIYWGWGAEDDDLGLRLQYMRIVISRPPPHVARYTMIKHRKRKENKGNKELLWRANRNYLIDGLNNAHFHVVFVKNSQVFTHVMVNVGLQ